MVDVLGIAGWVVATGGLSFTLYERRRRLRTRVSITVEPSFQEPRLFIDVVNHGERAVNVRHIWIEWETSTERLPDARWAAEGRIEPLGLLRTWADIEMVDSGYGYKWSKEISAQGAVEMVDERLAVLSPWVALRGEDAGTQLPAPWDRSKTDGDS